MAEATIACPACHTPWPPGVEQLAALRECPGCGRELAVATFPAFLRSTPVAARPEKVVTDGEASCFYHADKRAVVPCSSCGRFLCALCDVEVGQKHLCPACIEAGRTKGKFLEFETSRTLWDSAALTLATVPLLLCFYPSIVCAPAALIVAIMGWRKPSSIVPRSRWRLWLAIILSCAQIGGWGVAIFYLSKSMLKAPSLQPTHHGSQSI